MAKAVAGLLVVTALAITGAEITPVQARGFHAGGLFGHAHRGHPINAWMGSRRLRLR